jgi:hypothetical protein
MVCKSRKLKEKIILNLAAIERLTSSLNTWPAAAARNHGGFRPERCSYPGLRERARDALCGKKEKESAPPLADPLAPPVAIGKKAHGGAPGGARARPPF